MHTLLLRYRGRPVCAGVMRLFGGLLAELPLVATRQDARRCGHARVLVDALEAYLVAEGVEVGVLVLVHRGEGVWVDGW
jgi:GNAT superfamily N-acetyltransferase